MADWPGGGARTKGEATDMSHARYGDGSLYGTSGLVYGTATVDRDLTWGILVDWDNNGVFDGSNEHDYIMSLRYRGGREFVFNSSGSGFNHPDIGSLEIEFLNNSGRFDPYNQSSELYGQLYQNQKIQVIIQVEETLNQYYCFTGYIKDIRPRYGAKDTVTLYADGAGIKLKDTNIKSTSVYTAVQFDNQISAALTLAEWDGGTNINTTLSDTMTYHWFSGNSADTEINDLADAAFGIFFVDEAGTATYISRLNGDDSTQEVTEDDIDYYYGIQTPAPREVIKNIVTVYSRARLLNSSVEIWRMVDTPLVATGTGNPIWASFSYNGQSGPATSITTPAATTDYTANSQADGGGTNRTANFSFSKTDFATAAKLIPTNSGADAYITLLKLRGNIITADEYTFAQSTDDDSVATYGAKEFSVKSNWMQDLNSAQEQADTIVGKMSTPRAFPRFKYKKTKLEKQFTTGLFEILSANFVSRMITGQFRVGHIERYWDISTPNTVETTVYCEPNLVVAASSTWVFPTTFPTIF